MKHLHINLFLVIFSLAIFSCNNAASSQKANSNLAAATGIENNGMLYKGIIMSDASLLMCGVGKKSNSEEKDALLVKTNKNGIVWSKFMGTEGIEECFNFVTSNIKGNILALGYQKQENNNTLLINLLDNDGKVKWSTASINCNGMENPQGVILSDESIMIAARNAHPDPSNTNVINILKLDASGNLVWSKQIESVIGVVKMIYSNNTVKLVCKQKGVFLDYSLNEKYHNFPYFTLTEEGEVFSSANLLTPKSPNSAAEMFDAYETNMGDIVLGGYTFNDLSPNRALSLLCFDLNGVKKWAKRFDFPQESMAKSIDFDGVNNLLVWGDGYGKGEMFYFTKIYLKDGNAVSASSLKTANTKQVRSIVSKGDDYWLCWDNTNQFAWSASDKNGSLAVAQTKENPKVVDIQCRRKESNYKTIPADFKLKTLAINSTDANLSSKKL